VSEHAVLPITPWSGGQPAGLGPGSGMQFAALTVNTVHWFALHQKTWSQETFHHASPYSH
jgi:hypothetical protein